MTRCPFYHRRIIDLDTNGLVLQMWIWPPKLLARDWETHTCTHTHMHTHTRVKKFFQYRSARMRLDEMSPLCPPCQFQRSLHSWHVLTCAQVRLVRMQVPFMSIDWHRRVLESLFKWSCSLMWLPFLYVICWVMQDQKKKKRMGMQVFLREWLVMLCYNFHYD